MNQSPEVAELLKKVRTVEIKAKDRSKNLFLGDTHSPFKGKGMTFSEVRAYQYGDDIKSIDWNVTARTGNPYVKIHEEEHELTIFFLIDCSGSSFFGGQQNRFELITELTAVLALSALHYQHRIGLLLFTDKIDLFLPPKKGTSQLLRMIRELLVVKPKKAPTNLAQTLSGYLKLQHQRTTCFILSDFMDSNFEKQLGALARGHDVIGVRFNEPVEAQFPALGLVQMQHLETGETVLVDTSSKSWQKQQREQIAQKKQQVTSYFLKANSDLVEIEANQPYLPKLKAFFQKRHSA